MTYRPWFPFYPEDFKKSRKVRAMPRAVRDMYRELLGEIWMQGPIPDDSEAVRALLAEPARGWEKVWPFLRGALQPAHMVIPHGSPHELTDDRLEAERQKVDEKSQDQRDRALKRWHGMPAHEPPQLHAHVPEASGEECGNPARSQITDHIQKEEQQNAEGSASAEQGSFELQEPPKPKRKAKEPSPERQDAIEVVAHYKRAWVERMVPEDGKPPAVVGADWKNLCDVVKAHGREASFRFVDRFLADPDPFLFASGFALRHLPARVNAYRATAKSPPAQRASSAVVVPTRHYPTSDEIVAEREKRAVERQARQRAELEREGYTWDDEGRMFDPQGRELDDRGRPKKAAQ